MLQSFQELRLHQTLANAVHKNHAERTGCVARWARLNIFFPPSLHMVTPMVRSHHRKHTKRQVFCLFPSRHKSCARSSLISNSYTYVFLRHFQTKSCPSISTKTPGVPIMPDDRIQANVAAKRKDGKATGMKTPDHTWQSESVPSHSSPRSANTLFNPPFTPLTNTGTTLIATPHTGQTP